MTKTALIVGGAGQIGRALARRLVEAGWRVRSAQRGAAPEVAGVEAVTLDRDEPGALAAALNGGVDLLVDCVAFDARHGRQLLEVQADVGAMVVMSSASVYRDATGRTLDEAASGGFPALPVPIGEDQPTTSPGEATYSTRKVALEQTLLQGARTPIALLRAGAVYGEGSAHCREWFFVRRVLDGRQLVPLAWGGASRFHVAAARNIAGLGFVLADAEHTGVLNIADPEAPDVARIGCTIAAAMNAELEIVPFDGPPQGGVGASPWAIPQPIVLDIARAEALGYRPVGAYGDLVGESCAWIAAAQARGLEVSPYIAALFDYRAEDSWLAANGR